VVVATGKGGTSAMFPVIAGKSPWCSTRSACTTRRFSSGSTRHGSG
jgi:hypothetical protein